MRVKDFKFPGFFGRPRRYPFETSHAKLDLYDGSDDLLVLFSSRHSHKFQGGGPFSEIKCNKLYLIDRTGEAWYQSGIPDFGDHLEGIADRITALSREYRFSRVTLHGASMGAYAAVALGALAKVDRVFAISPQIEFNDGWTYTPPDEVARRNISVAAEVRRAVRTKFEIVSSSEVLDVYHLSLITGLPNVNIAIDRGAHNVLRSWKMSGTMRTSIKHIMSGGSVGKFNQSNLPLSDLRPRLKKTLSAFYKKDYLAAAEAAKQLTQISPDWADAHLFIGKSFLRAKQISKALPYLSRAHALNNLNTGVYRELIMASLNQGSRVRAEELLAEYAAVLEVEGEDIAKSLELVVRSALVVGDSEFASKLKNELIPRYAGANRPI